MGAYILVLASSTCISPSKRPFPSECTLCPSNLHLTCALVTHRASSQEVLTLDRN